MGCTNSGGIAEPDCKFYKGFKSHEDIKDCEYADLFDEGTKSALKRNMTKEIWDEYKGESCEQGVSFLQCVFSGVANQDSGIGLYAGSH